uniref:Sushi domain-containing protein n=1 Tax=Ciona savignyi TaxID=51511 RepID=H2ZPL3_CIOSA
MRAGALVVTLFSLFTVSHALQCWICTNARSNAECLTEGELQTCQANQRACQNEVRTDNLGLRITKRCKQAEACDNNFIQNPRPAWYPAQCNPKVRHTVCRCCCDFDECNRPAMFCLDSLPQCQAIGTPRFGSKDCAFRSSMVEVGSVCSFTCNRGYRLQGDARSTCRMVADNSSASFDNPVPTCVPTICRPAQRAPSNGGIVCTDENRVGSVCTFSCRRGYFLSGSTTTTCADDFTWNNSPPICLRVTCDPPHSNPASGSVSCSSR